MERTITGTVEKVYDPTASNRPWNIVIDGKRCAAWAPKGSSGDRCPLAEVAKTYVGSNVEAKVDESQNGEYTNYKLLSIKLADYGATEHSTSTIPVTTGSGSTSQATTGSIPVSAPEKKGWQPEDTARVTRLSCLSTAFQFMGSLYSDGGADAVEMATDDAVTLARRLYGIAMGKAAGADDPVPVAAAITETTEDVPW